MLQVDVRELRHGPVDTDGRLGPDDETFAGLDLRIDGPVEVRGRLQRASETEFFWHARLAGTATGTCRRCLKDLRYPLDAEVEVLFSADPATADDPEVYPLALPVTRVDLRPAIREEVALAISE